MRRAPRSDARRAASRSDRAPARFAASDCAVLFVATLGTRFALWPRIAIRRFRLRFAASHRDSLHHFHIVIAWARFAAPDCALSSLGAMGDTGLRAAEALSPGAIDDTGSAARAIVR